MAARWTREQVLDFVGDDVVGFMNAEARTIPLPDWLARGRPRTGTHTPGQRLAATHPDDRQKAIDLWWEAIRRPGEPLEVEVLIRGDGGWSRERVRQLNLLDQDDVDAMVFAVRFLGSVAGVELPEVIQSGEFEAVDLLIHELDETGVILRTEGKVLEISGRLPEDVIGQSVLEHIHPDGFEDALSMWMEVMTGPPGTTRSGRQRVVRPDGSTIWTENTIIKRVADDGTITATLICHDLTERRRRESALRASQLQFQLLAEQVPAAVFQADNDHRLTFRNGRWAELLEDEAPVEFLSEIVHPDDRGLYELELERLVDNPSRAAEFEVRSRHGDRVYAISCQSVLDLVNERRSFVGAVTDITSTVQLRERAERDSLTGLLNRAALQEQLALEVRESADEIAVVFVDLDNFKEVNDEYGHQTGDNVLVVVARRLEDAVRSDDIVARYGGDEFVVVLRHAGIEDAAIADRLRSVLAEPIPWELGVWCPEASIGVARPGTAEASAAVLRRADEAMFAVKRAHKAASVPRSAATS